MENSTLTKNTLGQTFNNAVHWLAEKPQNSQTFFNPFGLIPASGSNLNRAGLIVERVIMLPTLFASAAAAVAGTALGHPVSVGAAVTAAKVASLAAGTVVNLAVDALDKNLQAPKAPQFKTAPRRNAGPAFVFA